LWLLKWKRKANIKSAKTRKAAARGALWRIIKKINPMTTDNYIQIFGYFTLASVTIWSAIYSQKKSKENLLNNPKNKTNPNSNKNFRKFFPYILLGLSLLFLIYSIYILSKAFTWLSVTFTCLAVLLTSLIIMLTIVTPIISIFEHQTKVISKIIDLLEENDKSKKNINREIETNKNIENNAP
jgi:hypothetical protein